MRDVTSKVRGPQRGARAGLLALALLAWWFGYRGLVPWVQRTIGWEQRVTDKDLSTLFGHWFMWQLPAVLLCVAVWLLGQRLGLMPSFVQAFGSGGSWRRVATSGLIATAILLAITLGLGAALGGTFGWHPYMTKMAGDLVSNMYEEIVNRGLMFSAFYGLAAGVTFPLDGKVALHKGAVAVAAVGSSAVFAMGHEQYPVPLRVFMGLMSIVVWAWPWFRARSLWAPWIPHTLGDVIGDSILKL